MERRSRLKTVAKTLVNADKDRQESHQKDEL